MLLARQEEGVSRLKHFESKIGLHWNLVAGLWK